MHICIRPNTVHVGMSSTQFQDPEGEKDYQIKTSPKHNKYCTSTVYILNIYTVDVQ